MGKLSASKLIFALLLLTAGIVLLLVNLNLISFEIKSMFILIYPFLLFILGVIWLIQGYSYKGSSRKFWGLFFLIFSGFLIADRFELITFGFWDIWNLWPFILIYWALSMLFGKKKIVTIKYSNNKKDKRFTDDYRENYDTSEIEDGVDNDWFKNNKNSGIELNNQSEGEGIDDIDKDYGQKIDEILELVDKKFANEMVRKHIKQNIKANLSKDKINRYINLEKEKYKWTDTIKMENLEKASNSQTNVNVLGMKIGDISFNSPNWPLEPIRMDHTIANYFIDFSKAYIPDGETPVFLKGRIGDIEILIPEDIPVKISVRNSIGDVTIFDDNFPSVASSNKYNYISNGYDEAKRKIKIEIQLSIGSVQIDKV